MILLLDARINPPPPKNNLRGILDKIYLFKVLIFKNGVDK
jgi:hypothetical protein